MASIDPVGSAEQGSGRGAMIASFWYEVDCWFDRVEAAIRCMTLQFEA